MPHIILLGNPGAGKSTLLSSLVEGTTTFNSGISIGRGKTSQLQIVEYKGGTYIDTPGLSDVRHREKAASEIEKAFKLSGDFKSGRVRPDDVATVRLVLEAVPQIGPNQYSIIINKMSKSVEEILTESKDEREELGANLVPASVRTGTNSIYYVPLNPELDDQPNKWNSLNPKLLNFIDKAPVVSISSEKVGTIQYSQFERVLAEVQVEISHLREDNAALRRTIAEREEQLGKINWQLQNNTSSITKIPVTVIIIGTGGGQRTLLNALVGEHLQLRSKGLLLKAKCKGTTYIVTLGLHNNTNRDNAVVALGRVLNKGGTFKVFFLVELDHGYYDRTRINDLNFIKSVLQVEFIQSQYSIIINKMEPEHVAALNRSANRMDNLLPGVKYHTESLLCYPTQVTQLGVFVEAAPSIQVLRGKKWYHSLKNLATN